MAIDKKDLIAFQISSFECFCSDAAYMNTFGETYVNMALMPYAVANTAENGWWLNKIALTFNDLDLNQLHWKLLECLVRQQILFSLMS